MSLGTNSSDEPPGCIPAQFGCQQPRHCRCRGDGSTRIKQQGARVPRHYNEAATYDRMAMGFQSLEE